MPVSWDGIIFSRGFLHGEWEVPEALTAKSHVQTPARDVWGKACEGWLGDYPYKVLDVATSTLSCPYPTPYFQLWRAAQGRLHISQAQNFPQLSWRKHAELAFRIPIVDSTIESSFAILRSEPINSARCRGIQGFNLEVWVFVR